MGFEQAAWDSDEAYLPIPKGANPYVGTLEPPVMLEETTLAEGEAHWTEPGPGETASPDDAAVSSG
jgi:hypothetical protein